MFELDFLSLLCNTNTLRNILMMLGTSVEQDNDVLRSRMTPLAGLWGGHLFFFFSKKPFLVVFVCLSFWCSGLDVDLIILGPEFCYLLG